MKLVVVTYGTEGDARPFAALCRGLINAGHEARLLADAATLHSAHAGDIRGVLRSDHAIAGVVAKAAASTRPHARWRRSPTRTPNPGCAPS